MPRYHMSVTLDCPDAQGLEYVEQFQDLIAGWRWVSEWRIGAGLPKATSTAPEVLGAFWVDEPAQVRKSPGRP